MAAVLACGPQAFLSHESAARLWRILPERRNQAVPPSPIHVSLHAAVSRRPPGICVHRRPSVPPEDITTHHRIPVTTPARTLFDIAPGLATNRLEAAVNEADALDLIDIESLREQCDLRKGQPGVRPLSAIIDRHTFRLTESELERRFLRIVRNAGLPLPETQAQLAGRVDFHWPKLRLVVETDGLRYHRTPNRQARDNRRMQEHSAAGRTAVRFSHHEIRYESSRVAATLARIADRLELDAQPRDRALCGD